MISSILVPLDGSSFGEHAIPLAINLARRAGAKLHLVHVHQAVPPATVAGVTVMDAIDTHLRQDEQAYLTDVVRRLGDRATARTSTALLDGDVTPALKDHASRIGADLVVMSTHGRGAFGRFWLGSVADELLREMPRPILLVRPHEGKPDFHREPVLQNILVPLDGSELAERVLPSAMALAELFDGTLSLLRIVQPVIRPSYLHEGSGVMGLTHSLLEEVQSLQCQRRDDAQVYLDRIAERVAGKGCRVRTRVIIDEQPAIGILVEAQSSHADLIAMETHGRRGLSRLFLGSVADKVVRSGVVPVLLHRQPAGRGQQETRE
jgi:nucleotide-binding universal stress UspA family protein